LEKTIQTLVLLLPQHNNELRKWYLGKRTQAPLDHVAIACGILNAEKRQIDNFKFWRDRLLILKQAFDDAEPKTITQFWWDNRRKVQWYTFWVAVLVLALTVFFVLL